MNRYLFVCALGLFAGPVAAQELRLDPPQLSARADRCAPVQRALCDDVGEQRAIDSGLSCQACESRPLPPDAIAPAAKARSVSSPDCLPGAAVTPR